ncbi:MAG: hypothetical protein IT583_05475, partial [Verrucomicrobia bacterium]|nr:hypothetical protein [Verrucomicrobiota bacterium]
MYSLTWRMVNSPKWKIEAARTVAASKLLRLNRDKCCSHTKLPLVSGALRMIVIYREKSFRKLEKPLTSKTVHGSKLDTAGGLGAILLWSTSIAGARSLSEQVGSVTGAAAVFSVSGIMALVALLRC